MGVLLHRYRDDRFHGWGRFWHAKKLVEEEMTEGPRTYETTYTQRERLTNWLRFNIMDLLGLIRYLVLFALVVIGVAYHDAYLLGAALIIGTVRD